MDLREGAEIDVIVSSVRDFGLLVDFDGRQGVVLLTNLYWDCVGTYPRMLREFTAGQTLRVKVLIAAAPQFSASIKHLHPEDDPWRDPGHYVVGSKHRGAVRLIFDNGAALVRLANGVDVVLERHEPQIRLQDSVDVVISVINVDRRMLWGEQI